jgi:hypothetical protein
VQFAPGQRPNLFPVFAILRMDAAAEPAVGIDPQMFAGAIMTAFSAGGATRLDDASG